MNATQITWALGATLIAACGSMLPSALLLALSSHTRRKVLPWLVAFAAGALLAAALVDLLPEALSEGSVRAISAALLAGILGFFVIDLVLAHRHGHEQEELHEHGEHAHATTGPLVLVGDGLHNFVDGVAIAAAFAVSTRVGIATTLAVLAHEVPQEVGNVALLIDGGWAPRRAFLANLLVQLLGVAGAGVATLLVGYAAALRPYVLAVACASFLYVSCADLIPSLHRGPRHRRFTQAAMLFFGATLITLLQLALG